MKRYGLMWLIFFGVLIWSAIAPHDFFTWVLEIAPAIVGAVVLAATYQRFQFSYFAYWVMLAHAVVLMVGGHYTYAHVPLFEWLREPLGWQRNNYDKLGHFMQGFSPAIITAEILWRNLLGKQALITQSSSQSMRDDELVARLRKWAIFLSFAVCMMISALYELIEWLVAELSGQSAEAFLGTQGYIWDTQSDMLFCMIGALVMLLLIVPFRKPFRRGD